MAEEGKGTAERSGVRPPYGRWAEAEGGRVALIGCRCRSCGETLFPERKACPSCLGSDLDEKRLEGPATLYNFTVVHQLPAGFPAPMVVGYGKFPEGVIVFAPIDADPKELKPGVSLALHAGTTKTDEKGEALVTYRFRQVAGREEGPYA